MCKYPARGVEHSKKKIQLFMEFQKDTKTKNDSAVNK